MRTSWSVTSKEDLDSGVSYAVVSGERELIVLHQGTGWQFWCPERKARIEPVAAAKSAVLDYERGLD